MKKLFLAFVCLQTAFLFSQTPIIEWQLSMGGSNSDICTSFDLTQDGGYILSGYTSSIDGDVTGNHGGTDGWIIKLDANRNVTWKKTLGGTGDDWCHSIQQTTDNGYIIAGRSNSNDGDVSGNHGSIDCWVVKLDLNGNIVWQKTLGGTGIENAESIQQTADGGYIMAGSTASTDGDLIGRSTGNSDDYWIVKLNASGNITWQKTYGGTSLDRATAIKQTTDGGYIVAGQAASSSGDVIGNHGSWDYWILKLNTSGNIVWKKAFGGTDGDYPKSIEETVDGGYIIGGYTSSADGDVIGSHGNIDGWIIKLDINGNSIWTKTFGGTENDWCYSITQTTDGGYIMGCISKSTDGDLTANNGNNDFWIVKLDNSASIIWQKSYGGTNNENTQSIQQVSTDSYIVGGYSYSNDLDIIQNQGSADLWLGKLSPCSPVNSSVNETACSSFTWTNGNGQTYNSSTTATHTIPNGTVNGCDSIVTLNLTISDLIAPVANITNLANVTAQCSVTSLTAPTATDNCAGTITGTHNASLPITAQGTTTVTWTYNDGNGNTSTQTQSVVIDDNTAPVANVANLANITSECSVTSLTAPTATDNCAGSVTGTHNASLPITAQGTTTITWTYNDGNGNTSTQTQNVVIDDNTAPVANVANLANITSECSVTSLTAPTATDNCTGAITGTHNASLPITAQGTTTVTWTYNDGNGNTSTQTQSVVIDDNTAPVANIANLANVTSECSVTSLTAPTATDNCSGSITGTHNASLPITAQGTTTVTWTYNDGNGNTSTQTQSVVITPINNGITQTGTLTLSANAGGYNYQWVDCNNGNQAINGETDQTFTATANGSYAVEIDNGSCTVTSNCITINTVGIESLNQKIWKVYPNPANEKLIVELDENTSIQIVDVFGKIVQTETLNTGKNNIDVSTLTSGVYFIQAGANPTVKFVKK